MPALYVPSVTSGDDVGTGHAVCDNAARARPFAAAGCVVPIRLAPGSRRHATILESAA